MALITAIIEDESGRQIGDGVTFPGQLVHRSLEAGSVCLRFVDPCGDTVFNRLQGTRPAEHVLDR